MTAPRDGPAAPAPLAPGLYIVATPIGNLADLSPRGADILRRADLIACEDTRVTATLLRAAGSRRPMLRLDDHRERARTDALVARMARESVALVSDAGTPLVSDPGFVLVRAAREAGVPVTTAPGPCAAVAALSISGLPADRFFFAGFLPAAPRAREAAIAALAAVPGTLIFHETAPRLAATLAALAAILGDRPAAVARELTKRHEEVVTGRLAELAARFAQSPPRGEIVVLVGPRAEEAATDDEVEAALRRALATMPPGRAAASVAAAFGVPRGALYARALALAAEDEGEGGCDAT
ncbi:16S rRNA (cytidine(1402)-2'-O)-methyltransferase [Thermaurantiacus tibetensis]|uniref:16S rRNA (cytidine(1402)-2'-O)-methyltransferase n=1 Tax=Thermaurantiacus tibetensis TaxID=2759035 RepID=UPI00188E6670|nr:16S rRNA (cytidine(1402)-2'-O)-methyltransferase [Thermaurantiacus tibetensis]